MVPRNSINSVWSYLLCPPAILRLQKNGGQNFEVVRSQRVPSIASETNIWSYLLWLISSPAISIKQKTDDKKFEVVKSQRVPSIASETSTIGSVLIL